jgi:hypothetical protein
MIDFLPDQKLIAKRQKTEGIISISSKGPCGEDNFKLLKEREVGIFK